jgi:thioester reductase-like protein
MLPITKEQQQQRSRCNSIMVIGTTGFLGPYIVASLLEHIAGSHVLCINRDPKGQERTLKALHRIQGRQTAEDSRLHFVMADVTRPNLGLTSDQIKDMGATVNEVIFNAWNPNWSTPLEQFGPLLGAVENAIAFSISSAMRPRITFVSSVCAMGEWPRNHPEQPKIPEELVRDHSNAMANGYGKSKYAAELLLGQASDKLGLEVSIARVGQVGGPVLQSTAQQTWPIQGWLYSIIRASKKKGSWPMHVQAIDWIPVDALAFGIAGILKQRSDKKVRVYNMVHPKPGTWSLLSETLQERFELEVQESSLPEWLDLFEPGEIKLLRFFKGFGIGREHDMAFENDNALTVLPSLDAVTKDQLEVWLSGWNLRAQAKTSKL